MKNTAQAVKQRVLVMALLPGILISIVIGGLYIWTRFSELDHQLLEKAQSNVTRLSTLVTYAKVADEMERVQQLASLALEDRDIRAVSVLNGEGTETIHAGPKLLPLGIEQPFPEMQAIFYSPQSLRVIAPLYRTDNYDRQQIMGWLQVEYSFAELQLARYRSLLFAGLLMILGLGAGIALCLRLGRAIIQPLEQMHSTIDRIHAGQSSIRLHTSPSSLLQGLEQAINNLLGSQEQSRLEMQKNVEVTTRELQETLETIEIQNVELDLARKEALQASKSKSEFLANMSHEIRTPLNGITGYTSLMLETELKPQQYEYLSTIEKSAQGLMTMLNDILDFSRIEAGKLELDNQPFNLREVIEDTLAIMAPEAHRKSLELVHFVYQDTPEEITGDRQRLSQILTNLVNNAVKFTQFGSVSVRAMLDYEDSNGSLTLKCTVTDTGSGLTQEQHSRLFKAFSQADASRTRKTGGTGLGLVISKSLVEQMQGEIGLESDLGQGSTFWFTFRTRRADSSENQWSKRSAGAGKNVLLCEPQELTRLSITHQLQSLGCRVQSFNTRSDLRAKLAEGSFQDLILLSQEDQPLDQVLEVAGSMTVYAPVTILTLAGAPEEYPETMPESVSTLLKPVSCSRLEEVLQPVKGGELLPSHKVRSRLTFAKSLNLLIVDDNPVNLKLLATILNNMGQNTLTASSGYEAVEYCRKQPFDLILMDVQMPGLDGLETTRRIRALEQISSRLPIIAVTAHALPEERKQILQCGMDDYMTKPVNARQLINMISHWTGNQPDLPRVPTLSHDSQDRRHHREDADSPVDFARSIQLAAGNEELAREMLDMLIHGFDSDLETLLRCQQEKDHGALLERVHRLHGACRYCGVPQLEDACYQLETRLKQTQGLDVRDVSEGMDRLIYEIRRIQSWQQQSVTEETAVEG